MRSAFLFGLTTKDTKEHEGQPITPRFFSMR